LNGDGVPEVLAGSPRYGDVPLLGSPGQAVLYSGADQSILAIWNGTEQDALGWNCQALGDLDGDGSEDFVIQNEARNFDATNRGLVTLYSGTSLEPMGELCKEGSRGFGAQVAVLENLTGAELSRILVSAPLANHLVFGNFRAGVVFAWEFNPRLFAEQTLFSATLGGATQLRIDFPSEFAGANYRVLASATGTGPSTFGIDVPLELDAVSIRSWEGQYWPANGLALSGRLSATGNARARLNFPAGALQPLVGGSLYLAVVALDQNDEIIATSVAVPVDVQM